jgi:hypothetical protein
MSLLEGTQVSFDPNKTGVFEPYKPRRWPQVAAGLIFMAFMVVMLVWLLSVS